MEIHNLQKSARKHFADFLAKVSATWRARTPGSVTDDSARRDGGRTTDEEIVSEQKMQDLGHTAIDHTRDESGS